MNDGQEAYQAFMNELQNVRTELQTQRQQFESQLQTQQEREDSFRTDLEIALARPPQPPAPTHSNDAPTPIAQSNQRPRARHPDPELFSGEDPKDYLSFKLNLRTKERATQHVNLPDENEMTEGLDEFLGQLLVLRCLVEDQITLV